MRKTGLSVEQRNLELTGSVDPGRREALKSIARFSIYVAPTTFVLIDSKSAFAQTCSGAQAELDILLAQTGGSWSERIRRRNQIRRLRRWMQQNGC